MEPTLTISNPEDMFLTRFDSSGNCLGSLHFGDANGSGLVIDNVGIPYVSGGFFNSVDIGTTTLPGGVGHSVYLAKSNAITGIYEPHEKQSNELVIYANPTLGKCSITIPEEFRTEKNLLLKIFDHSGKIIQQVPVTLSEETVQVDLEEEAKGVYNVTLGNGRRIYSGRIVFQ